jgi:bla regulator protein blaR1
MILGQSNFLQALGWALLNSLWQMAFLWVIYQVITGISRKASSSHKSSLASVLLIGGFAWFVYTFFSILTAATPDNGAIYSVIITTSNNEQLNSWMFTMLPVTSMIYLILLLLPVFNFIRNYRYVQAIRRYELSKIDVEWRIFVQKVAARMGIKKPVHIWLSGLVTSPVTIGYIKPVILLPIAAINHLSTQQMEAILLHELAHIRRHDYLLNLFIRFIQAILYFNPFVKAFVKIIEREREKSCDEMVIQFQYDPYGYATALLTLEKNNHLPKPLAVAASGKKNDLLHRIECMLGVQKKQVFSFNKLAGLLAGLLCFIALNALLIMSKPATTSGTVASVPHLSPSPFYLFTGDEEGKSQATPAIKEIYSPSIVNNIRPRAAAYNEPAAIPETYEREAQLPLYSYAYTNPVSNLFMNVALTELNQPPVPQLKEYQEVQVKEAVEASRKVLEEKQWKAVENKIADVMTTYEKSIVKSEYDKEMSKVDWKKMEDKLRVAYDNIEWNKVNEALNNAVAEIKIDSLHNAYSQAMVELTSLQKQLKDNHLTGIPDTDVSLKAVEQGKKEMQTAINSLIRVKAKKIVHL